MELGVVTRSNRPQLEGRGTVRPRALARWNQLLIALSAVTLMILAYCRRWITDDGLIYIRPIRQIIAGRGPTFNPGERVESATSALWQWLVALVAWISGIDPARVAVTGGILLSGFGLAAAMAGAAAARAIAVRNAK